MIDVSRNPEHIADKVFVHEAAAQGMRLDEPANGMYHSASTVVNEPAGKGWMPRGRDLFSAAPLHNDLSCYLYRANVVFNINPLVVVTCLGQIATDGTKTNGRDALLNDWIANVA